MSRGQVRTRLWLPLSPAAFLDRLDKGTKTKDILLQHLAVIIGAQDFSVGLCAKTQSPGGTMGDTGYGRRAGRCNPGDGNFLLRPRDGLLDLLKALILQAVGGIFHICSLLFGFFLQTNNPHSGPDFRGIKRLRGCHGTLIHERGVPEVWIRLAYGPNEPRNGGSWHQQQQK